MPFFALITRALVGGQQRENGRSLIGFALPFVLGHAASADGVCIECWVLVGVLEHSRGWKKDSGPVAPTAL